MGMLRFYYVAGSSPYFVVHMLLKYRKYMNHPEKYNREDKYRLAQHIMDHMRRRGRTKTEVFGLDNLPNDTGYIIYPNHQGKYDALGIMLYHDEPMGVLMEKKQSEKIVAKQVIDLVEGKRLDFDDPRQQLRVLNEIGHEVAAGRKYLIFPEGKWGDNKNKLQKFNSGCFRCSIASKTPIVPCVLVDSYKALNGNSLKKCTTQIHYLTPIPYEEYKDLKKTEISELVKSRIQTKLDEILEERDKAND